MKNAHILISGAGIAGSATALMLQRYGFTPTVIERAPVLPEGGYAVDFRGTAHMQVLERMGILAEIQRRQTHMGAVAHVDAHSKVLAYAPAEVLSGDVEILRGDLAHVLHDATRNEVEYIFDDAITSLVETDDGVQVSFAHGAPRQFDLVVGADGLHSNVRSLVFGPEAQYIRNLGYYVAIFTVPNFLNLDHTGRYYNIPNKLAGIYSARDNTEAKAMMVFAAPHLDYDRRNLAQQKQLLADVFAGVGWEVPRILDAMWNAPDFYFDAQSQIHMERWSQGRVVLVGDAGYGATMGGMGTGLAVVGSYILAGELAAAQGDHTLAFPRYEQLLRAYAAGCQEFATHAGPYLAPSSNGRIWMRNQMYRMLPHLPWKGLISKMSTKAANAITLKTYPI